MTHADVAPAVVRLVWVDNLKVAVIAGVVVVHAAMAYLIEADWYYTERTTSQLWPVLVGLPGLLGGVFALGPLFLLGGVFAAASLAAKGPGRFVHGRLLRLGVPLLLYVVVINPAGQLRRRPRPRQAAQAVAVPGARERGPRRPAAVVRGRAAGLQPRLRRLAPVASRQ
jgi:hypothetical protein